MHSGSLEKEQSQKIIDILMIALGNLTFDRKRSIGFFANRGKYKKPIFLRTGLKTL
jgi:hypothetical protein